MNYNKIDRKLKVNVRKENDSKKGRGGKKKEFAEKYTPLLYAMILLLYRKMLWTHFFLAFILLW